MRTSQGHLAEVLAADPHNLADIELRIANLRKKLVMLAQLDEQKSWSWFLMMI